MSHFDKSIPLEVILILLVSVNVYGQYSGGSGTAEDPYQIATAADLIALGEKPEDYDKHFKLMADIDLSGFDGKDGIPVFNMIGPAQTRRRRSHCILGRTQHMKRRRTSGLWIARFLYRGGLDP